MDCEGRREAPFASARPNGMDTALGLVLLAVSVAGVAVAFAAFVWAARKDGEKDEETQRRLGIRRRTRLGR